MSRRGHATQSDSLDLLLDTICNSFGGIVFISLLVVILLNMTSRNVLTDPPTEADQASLVEAEEQLRERQQRLDTLAAAVQQQEWAVQQFGSPDIPDLMEQQGRLANSNSTFERLRNELVQDNVATQADINRIAQEMQVLTDSLAKSQDQLNSLERELADEISVRTRAAKLPKQRATRKDQVAFLLKGGQLYAANRLGPGNTLVPNEGEIQQVEEGGEKRIVPRPGKGLAIAPDGTNAKAIAAKLNVFDKDRHFIATAVWPDSFVEFQIVKDVIVSHGFEYRLLPLTDKSNLYVAPSNVRPTVQ